MRAVVQRVLQSSVSIGGELTASIERGLMVLVGVEVGDMEKDARYIADKCVGLRIFDDENGAQVTCHNFLRILILSRLSFPPSLLLA